MLRISQPQKKTTIAQFYLHEIPKAYKFIATESSIVCARGRGGGGGRKWGGVVGWVPELQFCKREHFCSCVVQWCTFGQHS